MTLPSNRSDTGRVEEADATVAAPTEVGGALSRRPRPASGRSSFRVDTTAKAPTIFTALTVQLSCNGDCIEYGRGYHPTARQDAEAVSSLACADVWHN